MKAISRRLLIIGLVALTGCKTETITETSFWQMLPFTGSKANPNTSQPAPTPPVVVTTIAAPTAQTVPTPTRPAATLPPVTPATNNEPVVTTAKKSKRVPPAVAINLPVTPSKKSSPLLSSSSDEILNLSANSSPSAPTTPTPSFPLIDWLYDEKAHEQWRQNQLDETKAKAPVHQYESAQLNRAFYNLILNESGTTLKTETPKP